MVDPFNPVPEDVNVPDMIHSISTLNRFTGQAKYPYSVGQHTINLTAAVPQHLKRAAIVHDFGESWFNDLASPVKAELPKYKRAESHAMHFIAGQLGVTKDELDELDAYDKAIYMNERQALFDNIGELGMGDDRTALDIHPIHFQETPWRVVRRVLTDVYEDHFNG